MTRNHQAELRAEHAAIVLRHKLGLEPEDQVRRAVILGTGWNQLVNLPDRVVKLADLPYFQGLGELEGHFRSIGCRRVGVRLYDILLFGRVHLNESCDPNDRIPEKVRLMVEMLCHPVIGIRELILTAAVGSLNSEVKPGDTVIVNSLVTAFAPDMPMYAGEFVPPADYLDQSLQTLARCTLPEGLTSFLAAHCMVRGPFFESLLDKRVCAQATNLPGVIGMSCLPETCIAALYGVKVLILGFVTNTMDEPHSHETNQQRAQAKAPLLSAWIDNLLQELARRYEIASANGAEF